MKVPAISPIETCLLELYITLSPVFKLWRVLNVRVFSVLSTPNPFDEENGTASNAICRDLVPIIGSRTAPDPFPPVIPIETTLSISKSCGSIKASTTFPLTQTTDVAPVPTPSSISILGGLITSYPLPPDRTSRLLIGP